MALYSYGNRTDGFNIADISLLDNGDLPDKVKYQLKVLVQFELPIDTGNLRYNALDMLTRMPGVTFIINQAEADYTEKVFIFYIEKRGRNFMHAAAVSVYDYLMRYFQGYDPQSEDQYKTAFESYIMGYSEDNEAREVRNIIHGTGKYASQTVKAQILGGTI